MIFLEKIFLMSYSINWPNFIVSLALLLQILSNMYIVIICFPVYDIINFEINLISYIYHKIISDALIWFFIRLLGNCCILHPWNILKLLSVYFSHELCKVALVLRFLCGCPLNSIRKNTVLHKLRLWLEPFPVSLQTINSWLNIVERLVYFYC